jgi:Flp pilus assembly protein TadD/cell division protein FtsN
MLNASFAKFAASSLVLGTALMGSGPVGDYLSSATAKSSSQQAGQANDAAKNARKALAKGKADKAVAYAERAVALSPEDAAHRMLLGEAYIAAGRFASAETSFGDVLDLSPANDRAALRLALMKTALGKAESARALIEANRSTLSPADYGLALALAGDQEGSVAALEAAIRTPYADARTRQNLALAYALAGKWPQARVLASQDLSPAVVDARMTQWAALARPKAAWDQVSAVLGVSPIQDGGQPVALALNSSIHTNRDVAVAAVPAWNATASAAPVAVAAPAPLFEVGGSSRPSAPVTVARAAPIAAPAPVDAEEAVAEASLPSTYHFGQKREVVQPVRQQTAVAPLVRAPSRPMKVAVVSPAKVKPAPGKREMIVEIAGARSAKSSVPAKPVLLAKASKPEAKPAQLAHVASKPVAKPVQSAKAPAKPVAKPVQTALVTKAPAKPAQTITSSKTGKTVQAGHFVVQLGAYANKASADSAWAKASARVAGLSHHNAVTASVSANGKSYQRLAVSGFNSAADAQTVCAKVKAAGGQCFVKGAANDGSRWAALKPAKAVQLAMR